MPYAPGNEAKERETKRRYRQRLSDTIRDLPGWARKDIRDRLRRGEFIQDVAKKYSVTCMAIRRVINNADIVIKTRRPYEHKIPPQPLGPQPGDPTPEQIEERAAEIRKGWTRLDYARRRVTPNTYVQAHSYITAHSYLGSCVFAPGGE